MANPSVSTRSTELTALNTTLRRCGLPMKTSLDFLPGEDAQFVHDCLTDVFRREQSKGWYLFNKADNQEFPLIILNPPEVSTGTLISARATEPWRDEGRRPSVRVEYGTGSGGIRDRILNLSNNEGKFQGRKCHLDLVWFTTWDKAPELFVSYVVELTALEMSPTFGVAPNNELVRNARTALEYAENDAIPSGNVYEDNDESVHLWAREFAPWL